MLSYMEAPSEPTKAMLVEALRSASGKARRIAELAEGSAQAVEAAPWRARKALRQRLHELHVDLRDATNHAALMVGYRHGLAARTEAREALRGRVPALDPEAAPAEQLARLGQTARVVADALEDVSYDLPPIDAPTTLPGPGPTAARARAHLDALELRLRLVLERLLS